MKNESIFWGVVLVLLGGLLLMENIGLLPPGVNIWTIFWPLILIAIGVRMMLRSSMRGTVIGGPVSGTTPAPGMMGSDRMAPTNLKADAYRLPLEGARSARVRIRHGAGELRIDDQAGPDELLSGLFAGGVDPNISRDGEQLIAELSVPSGNFVLGPDNVLNWTVGFNPNVPLSLDLQVGASRSLLDLRNMQVKELRLETGASETQIQMPARAGLTTARLKSGMARVEVRIPDNVSARIHTGGALSSLDVDTSRFPRTSSNDYMSPDYEISGNRVDLEIESGMGAVQVR